MTLLTNQTYLQQAVQQVRAYARDVWNQTQHLVQLDETVYPTFVTELQALLNQPTDSLGASEETQTAEQEAALKTYLGVVNYCFVNPHSGEEYSYRSPTGAVIKRTAGFYAALANSGIDWTDSRSVKAVSLADWHRMMQTDSESHLFELDHRLARLQTFAAYLEQTGIGSIVTFVEQNPQAGAFLKLLLESGLFDDPFLKRAQLTVYMVSNSLQKRLGLNIEGLDQLSLMADYRLPQVLYNAGVVKLVDDGLRSALLNKQVIDSDSLYEKALRASVIVVGERLARDLGVSESRLDKVLWELSQHKLKHNQMPIPAMLVPTDRY